tara:strand:- start:5329 stop:5727 length:399 start_codon:yes stop_codon:yes gene_type:complete
MDSISVIFEKYGLIIFILIILVCFGCCIYKFCTEYTQEQINAINRVSDEREVIERIRMRQIQQLQIENELIENEFIENELIEIRAQEQRMQIINIYKVMLKEMVIKKPINEDVVVIVNPDGRQLQLGTKIID